MTLNLCVRFSGGASRKGRSFLDRRKSLRHETSSLPYYRISLHSGMNPMTRSCPHCGAHLPVTSDPFCGECRQSVGEIPAAPLTPEQVRAGQLATAKVLKYLGCFSLIAAISTAVKSLPNERGSVEDFVGVAFAIVGAGLLGVSYWLARRTKKEAQRGDESGSASTKVG